MQTLHPVLSSQAEEPISEKWTFLNGKTLKAIAGLVVSLVVGLVIAFGILNLKPPAALRDGQLLAREIAKAAARSDSVPVASGTYVPGNGIILYSQVAYNSDTQIFLWLSTQLQAQGERLAQMPSNETLTWIVDYRLPVGSGPDLAEQKVLQAPLSRAGDPALHQYIDSPSEIASSPAAQPETAEVPVEVVQVQAKPAQPETIAEAAAAPSEAKFVDEAPALQTDAAGVAPLVESVEQESPLFASNFIENDAGWRPLSGEWQVIEGAYRQNNATGYDFISMIDTNRLTDYSLETKFRFIEAEMGGGLIYHAPSMDTRAGAQSIDFTDKGGFLRWGYYDKDTHYNYTGGAQIDPSVADGQWHTLRLVTHATQTTVYLDEQQVAVIENINQNGHVGLTTSLGQVDFDDTSLVLLPAKQSE